jgi:hypothetical protein
MYSPILIKYTICVFDELPISKLLLESHNRNDGYHVITGFLFCRLQCIRKGEDVNFIEVFKVLVWETPSGLSGFNINHFIPRHIQQHHSRKSEHCPDC